MPAPGMAHNPRLVPTELIEHPTRVIDVCRDGIRSLDRGRRQPSLLVPDHVVLLRKLVGETAEVVEAQPRPPMQQQNRKPATSTATRDHRPTVGRYEIHPHQRCQSYAAVRASDFATPSMSARWRSNGSSAKQTSL